MGIKMLALKLMAKRKAYFGVRSLIINLILWLFLGWVLSPLTRILRGRLWWGILSLLLWLIFMWIDLVTLISKRNITVKT